MDGLRSVRDMVSAGAYRARLARSPRFRSRERRRLRRVFALVAWLTVATLIVGVSASALVDRQAAVPLVILNLGTAAVILALIGLGRRRFGRHHIEALAAAFGVIAVVDLFVAGLLSPSQLVLAGAIMPLLPLLFALFMPVPTRVQLLNVAAAVAATIVIGVLLREVGDASAWAVFAAGLIAGGLSAPGHLLLRRARIDAFDQLLQIRSLHGAERDQHRRLLVLNGELAETARIDPLTGLWNRLRLHEDVAVLPAGPSRAVALVLVDVDHFKGYNDALGHLAGDDVLRRLAGVLVDGVRAGDGVYRYGGEEFLVLLRDIDARGVEAITTRILGAIAALGILHPVNIPWSVVTASAGVAIIRPDSAGAVVAGLRAADEALYRAKRTGRNRLVTSGLPSGSAPGSAGGESASATA